MPEGFEIIGKNNVEHCMKVAELRKELDILLNGDKSTHRGFINDFESNQHNHHIPNPFDV